MDIAECYQLLEIEPTDSLKEIKQAYRDIVFVWHPDRLGEVPRIQEKAGNKLKRLNEAYESLQSYFAHEISRLTRIAIYPQQVILNFGEQYTFLVVGFDQNGNEVELEYVLWSVSGGGTIYAEGSFFADYESGSFTVTATFEGISDIAKVLIKQPVGYNILEEMLIKQPVGEAVVASEKNEESYKIFEDWHLNSVKLTSEEPEADVGLPWKRLLFWGFLTFAMLMSDPQNLSSGIIYKVVALLFLGWIVGLIKPKAVFKFGLSNTRASVTQIYLCLPTSVTFLTEGDSTIWESIGGLLIILWFIGMVNPRATLNLGYDTRGEMTGLYILLGLITGGIWGGLKGISFFFSGT